MAVRASTSATRSFDAAQQRSDAAVAPPPDAEGRLSLLLSELDNASALHFIAVFVSRSDAVRDLALRLEGGQLFFVINEGL